MVCKKCNAQLAEDAQFCKNCGTKVETEMVQQEQNVNSMGLAGDSQKANKKPFPKAIIGIVAGILLVCVLVRVVPSLLEGDSIEFSMSFDETVDISEKIKNWDLFLALISGLPAQNVIFDRDIYLANIEQYEEEVDPTAQYFMNYFKGDNSTHSYTNIQSGNGYTWDQYETDEGADIYLMQHKFGNTTSTEHKDGVKVEDGQIVQLSLWIDVDEQVEKQAKKLSEYLSSTESIEDYEGNGIGGYRDGYRYEYTEYEGDVMIGDEPGKIALLNITKE